MIEVSDKKFSAPKSTASSNSKFGRTAGNNNWPTNAHFWQPPTDLYETDNTFVVVVEIAGMGESEFVISLEKRTLIVSGDRPHQGGGAYHQMEIFSGEFVTLVELPAPVRYEDVSAEYDDGFLTITLPKTEIVRVAVKTKNEQENKTSG